MSKANVWRLIAHHEDRDAAIRWSLQNEKLAIGWGAIGNIGAGSLNSAVDIRDAIRETYPQKSNATNGGFSLWDFYSAMKIGDRVILRGIKSSCVVEVVGDYLFDKQNAPIPRQGSEYFHQRDMKLTGLDPDVLWEESGKMAPGNGSIYRTLVRCAKPIEIE